ncbi:MAG: class I SAM-dependent methyltransferase [Gemmatirosa sp.]
MTTTIAEEDRIRDAYHRRDARVGGRGRGAWFDPAYVHLAHDVERAMLDMLRPFAGGRLGSLRVLEVGCGGGAWLQSLVKWGAEPARVVGIDLMTERLAGARRTCAPGVTLACASGTRLPLADASQDLVLQATVFTSILDPDARRDVAREMRRVLAPGGAILWYDFRIDNPKNPDVRGVGRREIVRLFPDCVIRLQAVTLAPPIGRLVSPVSWTVAHLLGRVPWLRTHYLGLLLPDAPASPAARTRPLS